MNHILAILDNYIHDNPDALCDFVAVGKQTKMSEKRCVEIYEEVRGRCGDLLRYNAEE